MAWRQLEQGDAFNMARMPRKAPTELSLQQARNLQLAVQGLLAAPTRAATPTALRRCIERMQLLQIDTIHVVARSPYLVLHSRLGHYPTHWLEQALAKAHIFESWAHEACFVPIGDWHLHRAYNIDKRRHWGLDKGAKSHAKERQHLDKLLAHIRAVGPVKSSDFERPDEHKGSGGWWGWKDEKLWLEALFARGELMVARRENFHRVYDLPERVVPDLLAQDLPTAVAVHDAFIEKAILALGVSKARWVHDYFRIKPRLKDADLDVLVAEGRVLRLAVEGWPEPGYVHADNAKLLKQALAGKLQATHTTLLSPFDPIVWDRERASHMFDFDYTIECYTPEAKRQYGYFVLPLLHRGELVGRLDAKAHRSDGVFEVKALFLQDGVKLEGGDLHAIAGALHASAAWHGTPQVQLARTSPAKLRPQLQKALRAVQAGS